MINADKLAKFIYWIEERENIRKAKARGEPAPWSEDKLLQQYRFCNVRRSDDKVSQWLINNVYKPNERHPLLWFMAACARWVNWPPAIKELMEKGAWPNLWFDAERFGKAIDERVARGEKSWTGAYMIHSLQHETMGKGMWISVKTLQPLYERRMEFKHFFVNPNKTVESAVSKVRQSFNHGSFMAGQIVADWTYTSLLSSASDLNSWAPVGPGSTRGMNRIHERPLEQVIPQDRFTEELQELCLAVEQVLPRFSFFANAMDVQNCLCEFDKYLRLENGGQVRSKYQSETRF